MDSQGGADLLKKSWEKSRVGEIFGRRSIQALRLVSERVFCQPAFAMQIRITFRQFSKVDKGWEIDQRLI